MDKPNSEVLADWNAAVHRNPNTPRLWGDWMWRTWTTDKRNRQPIDHPIERGTRRASSLSPELFEGRTAPAVTFNGHVVFGETDLTLIIVRPPYFSLLADAVGLRWQRDTILRKFPHMVSCFLSLMCH